MVHSQESKWDVFQCRKLEAEMITFQDDTYGVKMDGSVMVIISSILSWIPCFLAGKEVLQSFPLQCLCGEISRGLLTVAHCCQQQVNIQAETPLDLPSCTGVRRVELHSDEGSWRFSSAGLESNRSLMPLLLTRSSGDTFDAARLPVLQPRLEPFSISLQLMPAVMTSASVSWCK